MIPTGIITANQRPFTRETMGTVLEEICAPGLDFTGFISITSGDDLILLCFFNGRPYAAGKIVGEKPASITITEFFREVELLPDLLPTISVHSTDPVQLKCLLVFIQNDPAAKAPTNLINLEAILRQIQQEATDTIIILEKQQMLNFFFFKDGKRGMSYFSDNDFLDGKGLPIDEQLLIYAFQPDAGVNALVYRTITTQESIDASHFSCDSMRHIMQGEIGEDSTQEEMQPLDTAIAEDNLVLEVLVGTNKGQTLTGAIPCVLGRKDADIIVADPLVSKRHAAIQVINGQLLLVDLNSTNGTTLNGLNISQHEIGVGDVIGLGGTALKVLRITLP